jgi:hypothetical protein
MPYSVPVTDFFNAFDDGHLPLLYLVRHQVEFSSLELTLLF